MRYALIASALLHVGLAALGYIVMSWPKPDEGAMIESVFAEVVTTSSFSSNETSTIKSDATENLVSSGGPYAPEEARITPDKPEKLEPVEEMVEPEPTPQAEPVKTEALKPAPVEEITEPETPLLTASAEAQTAETAQAIQPIRPEETEPEKTEVEQIEPEVTEPEQIEPEVTEPEKTEAVEPIKQASLTPTEVEELPEVPTPAPRPKIERDAPKTEHKPRQTQTRAKPQPAGNSGASQADARASRQASASSGSSRSTSAGNAAVSNYPGKVTSRLRRAIRTPRNARGATGNVVVSFTVSGSGSVSNVKVVQSSGNSALDQAAIETVHRAAPFPKIPSEANRSTWAFTQPLAFTR